MSAASRESASVSNHFQTNSISSRVKTPIAGGASVVWCQPGSGIGLNDVLRQRPAEHCRANLPTFLRLPPLAPIDDRVQERPHVTSANLCSISLKDGRQCAPQTALNRLGCAQAANNSPSQIEVDQLLDGDPRGCGVSGPRPLRRSGHGHRAPRWLVHWPARAPVRG